MRATDRVPGPRRRAAFGLVEVLVGLAVLGVLGGAILQLSSGGARSSARATELQLATVLAARCVDQLLSTGYARLAEQQDQEQPLDMRKLAPDAAGATALMADGFSYQGRVTIEKVRPGLIRLVVTFDWRRDGPAPAVDAGSLTVLRYVADPLRTLAL